MHHEFHLLIVLSILLVSYSWPGSRHSASVHENKPFFDEINCRTCVDPACPSENIKTGQDCFALANDTQQRPEFLYQNVRLNYNWNYTAAKLINYLDRLNVSLPLILLGGVGGSGSRLFARLIGELDSVYLAYNTLPELDFLVADGLTHTANRLAKTAGDPCNTEIITSADLLRSARALAVAALGVPRNRRVFLALKHGSMLTNAAVFAKLLGNDKVVILHYIRDGREMSFSSNQNQLLAYSGALRINKSWPVHVQQSKLWARINVAAAKCLPFLFASKSQYIRVAYHELGQAKATAKQLSIFLNVNGVPVCEDTLVRLMQSLYVGNSRGPARKTGEILDEEFLAAECFLLWRCK